MKKETIAAISTGMTPSGIGIVRISGEEAFEIIDKVYESPGGKKKLSKENSHTIHYGYIKNVDEVIDEVLVMLMRGPKSFTGEDTIEINCHGGILSMKKILEAVVANGARPAEPGEFTKRAFLNGKLDLSQAEAVIDIINSKNEYALKSSLNQLKGSVQHAIKEIREKILYHIAFIESALDDPEHISLDGYQEQLLDIVEEQQNNIWNLISSFDDGKIIKEGVKTVIVGKPNAGKSSLLNILVGEEKAIVTDVAGTTRDILEEQIKLNGINLNIVDTAGIRNTEDVVEKIGVKRALEQADEADLIIYVVDSSTVLDENDHQIMEILQNKKVIILMNKADLEELTSEEEIKKKLNKTVISISAKNREGIQLFEEELKKMFFKGEISFNDQVYITNVRHKTALVEAKKSLDQVKKSIEEHMPEDFYSIDLMNAYEELGTITGETVGEDLVNEIFSKFCMGK